MLVATNIKEVREINIFAVVLVVQSLPFLAAVGARRVRAHAAQRLRLPGARSKRALGELLAAPAGAPTPVAAAAAPVKQPELVP